MHNGKYRDPNLGAVNLHIPDVFHAGRCFYTYWFSTNFSAPLNASAGQRARLTFHGINYSARYSCGCPQLPCDCPAVCVEQQAADCSRTPQPCNPRSSWSRVKL